MAGTGVPSTTTWPLAPSPEPLLLRAVAGARPRRATCGACGPPRARRRQARNRTSGAARSRPRSRHDAAMMAWNPCSWPDARGPRGAGGRPAAALVPVHVDGVLDSRGVRGTGAVGGERPEPEHAPGQAGVRRTARRPRRRRVSATVGVDPLLLLLERPGHQIEGHLRGRDLEVVDAPYGLGVGSLGHSGSHPPHGSDPFGPRTCAGTCPAILS